MIIKRLKKINLLITFDESLEALTLLTSLSSKSLSSFSDELFRTKRLLTPSDIIILSLPWSFQPVRVVIMTVDQSIYKQLQDEFRNANANLERIGALLPSLIVQSMSDQPHVQQDILEMAAYWAAHKRDGLSFERFFDQLQSLFYFCPSGQANESPRKWPLVGLQLLNLLVKQKLNVQL